MVKTDWQIGKMIVEKQGGKERTEYGKDLNLEKYYKTLSQQLSFVIKIQDKYRCM